MRYIELSDGAIRELEGLVKEAIEKCTDEHGEVDETCVEDVFDERSKEVADKTGVCDPLILMKMLYDYYTGEGGWSPGLIEEELLTPEECVFNIIDMAEKLYCYVQLVDAWWTIRNYYKGKRK